MKRKCKKGKRRGNKEKRGKRKKEKNTLKTRTPNLNF